MSEFCKCEHSKKSHVNDFDNTRCCQVWQTKEDLDNRGSLLRFCECMKFELENENDKHLHVDVLNDEALTQNKEGAKA